MSGLQQLPALQLLVSCSMDGTLRLWSLESGAARGTPLKAHVRGVVALAYDRLKHVLYSAGLDRHVYVWNPFLETPLCALKVAAYRPPCPPCLPRVAPLRAAGIASTAAPHLPRCLRTYSLSSRPRQGHAYPLVGVARAARLVGSAEP